MCGLVIVRPTSCRETPVPIRREFRDLYPAHWRDLSRHVRFERRRRVPGLWPTALRHRALLAGWTVVRFGATNLA
jgi:hypothetical protein